MTPAPTYFEWAANEPSHETIDWTSPDMESIRQRWVESYWEAVMEKQANPK